MKSEATLSTYVVTDGCVRAIGPRTLENLSPEILIIIFEQLYVLDPLSFPLLVSLSRRLNGLIAPLRYSKISLTPKMLDFTSEVASRSTFLEHVTTYCRHIYLFLPRLSKDLDAVARLLLKCSCVREISWYTIEGRDPRHRRITPIPPSISKIISQSSPPIRFNLSCHQIGHHADSKFFKSIPALHLKCMHFVPPPTPPPSLPLQSPFKKPKGTELSSFVSSIPPIAVPQLRSLRITMDFPRFGPATSAAGLTAKLCNWIKYAPFLEILEIPCLFEELGIPAILGCRHLRVLKLWDLGDLELRVFPPGKALRINGVGLRSLTLPTEPPVNNFNETSCYPTLSIESIEKLKEACPLIDELDIGFNNKHENASCLYCTVYSESKADFFCEDLFLYKSTARFPMPSQIDNTYRNSSR